MTKKHFIWAADYIRKMGEEEDALLLIRFCKAMFFEFGKNFDYQRFEDACEPGTKE